MIHVSAPAPAKAAKAASARGPLPIQRCSCGADAGHVEGECEACRRKRLQRRALSGGGPAHFEAQAEGTAASVRVGDRVAPVTPGAVPATEVPDSVHALLALPGAALDPVHRAAMEAAFAADFSAVRIHRGPEAAASVRDVEARAYTVGTHIVFGAGEFAPATTEGRALLAHELAHTLQQGAVPRALQRACLAAAACAAPKSTLTEFVAATEARPANVSKADKRRKACAKAPVDPKCTSDGHAAPATALTKILTANNPSRLGFITGIFVNKDMPSDWGAVTQSCSSFMPPLPGGQCTFVPDTLEAEAKQFEAGAKTIGGLKRADWLTRTLGTLVHQTEHARFDAAPAIAEPTPTACKFADLEFNLSEMAAHLAEMHVYYRAALTKTGKNRFTDFKNRFAFWVTNGSEDIAGIVKDLRCRCECADADYYIRKTVESVSTSQKWDTNEATMIHTELADPKWGLNWPVAPPAAVNIADLPPVGAAPLKLE